MSLNISVFQPLPDPTVTVGFICLVLTLLYFLCQLCITLGLPNPSYKVIVAAPGYLKKSAHNGYRILVPVTIDNCVLYFRPHILSASFLFFLTYNYPLM